MSFESGFKRDREVRFLRSGGREFQSWGAERLKALLPMVLRRAEVTVRWVEEEDLRERAGVAIWRSDRYGGARLWMALKVYTEGF